MRASRLSAVAHVSVCLALVLLSAPASVAWAWGPHPDISRAALEVLPEADHWRQVLTGGATHGDQFGALTNYSWLPDLQGLEWGDFSVDDYLLIRAVPRYVNHGCPHVKETWEPYFRRALQALRTETPVNAARQMGPIVHWVEDTGAPPHAAGIHGPLHDPLENWVRADAIAIKGYAPQLLGNDDETAVTGLRARLEGLVAFSLERANRAKPLAEQGEAARAQVEPILLESATECARVLADVLHTLFALAEAPHAPGAGLRGTITAGPYHSGAPQQMMKSARLALLDHARYEALGPDPASLAPALTDYTTNAYGVSPQPAGSTWQGGYGFRNLPPGVYRLWAYRVGSRPQVSGPLTVTDGRVLEADLDLPADHPPGNIIQNPRGAISLLTPEPDRWTRQPEGRWLSRSAPLEPGLTYRCGAVLKDAQVRVALTIVKKPPSPHVTQPLAPIAAGQSGPEVIIRATDQDFAVAVTVETARPLVEVLDHVWVVPVP